MICHIGIYPVFPFHFVAIGYMIELRADVPWVVG